jgi:hypothetical protein
MGKKGATFSAKQVDFSRPAPGGGFSFEKTSAIAAIRIFNILLLWNMNRIRFNSLLLAKAKSIALAPRFATKHSRGRFGTAGIRKALGYSNDFTERQAMVTYAA